MYLVWQLDESYHFRELRDILIKEELEIINSQTWEDQWQINGNLDSEIETSNRMDNNETAYKRLPGKKRVRCMIQPQNQSIAQGNGA